MGIVKKFYKMIFLFILFNYLCSFVIAPSVYDKDFNPILLDNSGKLQIQGICQ